MDTILTAAAPGSRWDYRTLTKIAKYLTVAEHCVDASKARKLPSKDVIEKINEYERKDVEKFLITRSFLMLKECERPELTELAYAILILEDSKTSEETQQAISAIKVLAFSSQNYEFERLYESLPKNMRDSLEKIEYFQEPFSNKEIRSITQKP